MTRFLKGVAKVLGILAGGLVAVIASLFLLFYIACEPPSLDRLARQFPSRQQDLELLVKMSGEDPQLSVVDPTWMMVQPSPQLRDADGKLQPIQPGKQYVGYDPETGISSERYNAYVRLFAKNNLSQGLRRYGDSGDIFFIVQSVGLLDQGYSNGYLFCGHLVTEPSRYPACESSSASGTYDAGGARESYEYHRVAPNWFVYRQGPG